MSMSGGDGRRPRTIGRVPDAAAMRELSGNLTGALTDVHQLLDEIAQRPALPPGSEQPLDTDLRRIDGGSWTPAALEAGTSAAGPPRPAPPPAPAGAPEPGSALVTLCLDDVPVSAPGQAPGLGPASVLAEPQALLQALRRQDDHAHAPLQLPSPPPSPSPPTS